VIDAHGRGTERREDPSPFIADWDGALYSLLFKNCAHFVVDVWTTVTGERVFPGANEDLMVDMWNPLMIGMAIDERNRQKMLMDQARPGGRASAAGPSPDGSASAPDENNVLV
jgi:hypothetical protein